MVKGATIVSKAREYLGTPFADKGRRKGHACDCVGLPLMVAGELGLRDTSGNPMNGELYKAYSSQPLGTYVHDVCCQHLRRKALKDMQPGDLLSIRMMSAPCHVAFYTGFINGVPQMLHAYAGSPNACVEHPLDEKWRRRISGVFSFPEVEE